VSSKRVREEHLPTLWGSEENLMAEKAASQQLTKVKGYLKVSLARNLFLPCEKCGQRPKTMYYKSHAMGTYFRTEAKCPACLGFDE